MLIVHMCKPNFRFSYWLFNIWKTCPIILFVNNYRWPTGELKVHSPAAYYMYTSALMFTSLSGAHVPPQKPQWLRHFIHPLTVVFRDELKWWSGVELGRRFLFLLFFIPFPRNTVSKVSTMSCWNNTPVLHVYKIKCQNSHCWIC